MTARKATKADKEAVRRLLGHDPDPHANLQRMIREVVAEGAKRGIQVRVDLRKTDGDDDPWISESDLQLVMAELKAQGITSSAAIIHPSTLIGHRGVSGTFIDASGEEREFEGRILPKAVKVGGMTMVPARGGGGWAPSDPWEDEAGKMSAAEFDKQVRHLVDKTLDVFGRRLSGPGTP